MACTSPCSSLSFGLHFNSYPFLVLQVQHLESVKQSKAADISTLRRVLAHLASNHQSIRIVLGATDEQYAGWHSTNPNTLNVADWQAFEQLLPGPDTVSAFLAEHVWEHLTLAAATEAAANLYRALKPGGYARIAVPVRS